MGYLGNQITTVFPSSVTVTDATVEGEFTSQGIDDNADANAITIDSSEQLGIGTASPTDLVHIKESNTTATSTQLMLHNNNTGSGSAGIGFQVSSDAETTSYVPKGAILFERSASNGRGEFKFMSDNVDDTNPFSSGDEVMRIDRSGNVGIGTSSPAEKLDVNGVIKVDGLGIQYTGITGGTSNRIAFNWSSPNLNGVVDNALSFVVGTASDHRIKNNVENLSSVLDKINLLRPITFNAIPLQEGEVVNDVNHIGFIAHEVAEHFPSLVAGEKDAVNDEGNNLYQSLNYAGFTPILTKAIQELKTENDTLKSQLSALEARVAELEGA